MSVRRFMIHSRTVRDGCASLDGDLYNHMVRVLRLGLNDTVQLADENGTVHSGNIDQITKESLRVAITSTSQAVPANSSVPRITICQALPKGDKIDLILQKGTELGASDFVLFGGCRSVAKIHEDQKKNKLERWNRITAEASRQCGRADIPGVVWCINAGEAAGATNQALRLILWEDEQEHSLKDALTENTATPESVIVAIGPEGGFDPLEIRQFSEYGYQPVSLGNRILRTETASIAILAVMQYRWGDM